MGHGYRGYDPDRGIGQASRVFNRVPRGLKIFFVVAILLILLVFVSFIGLVALVLIKAVNGGSLPGFLQGLLNFFQQNVQPLLDIWNQVQNLIGG